MRFEHVRVVDDWRRIEIEWIHLDGDQVISRHKLDHWLYSAGELIDLFTGVGFEDIACFSGWKDAPYDPSAFRLLVMGQKP